MNNQYITYHLHEVEDEITNIILQIKSNPDFSEEEYKESMKEIYRHLNISWNGRNAQENPSKEEVTLWSKAPTPSLET